MSTDVKVFPCGRNGRNEQPLTARYWIETRRRPSRTEAGPVSKGFFVSFHPVLSRPVMESDAVAAVSAESQKRKREEYEMQLFGFHSRAVYATRKSPPFRSRRATFFSDRALSTEGCWTAGARGGDADRYGGSCSSRCRWTGVL